MNWIWVCVKLATTQRKRQKLMLMNIFCVQGMHHTICFWHKMVCNDWENPSRRTKLRWTRNDKVKINKITTWVSNKMVKIDADEHFLCIGESCYMIMERRWNFICTKSLRIASRHSLPHQLLGESVPESLHKHKQVEACVRLFSDWDKSTQPHSYRREICFFCLLPPLFEDLEICLLQVKKVKSYDISYFCRQKEAQQYWWPRECSTMITVLDIFTLIYRLQNNSFSSYHVYVCTGVTPCGVVQARGSGNKTHVLWSI